MKSTSTRPDASTGIHRTSAPSCLPSHSTGSRTAWCSIADAATIGSATPSRARRAHKSPLTARLSDSVPPEVKTTAEGRVRRSSAMDSRACSTILREARPDACRDDGLPATAEASSQASRAWASSGVVAAWSTKCRTELSTSSPATPPPALCASVTSRAESTSEPLLTIRW